MLLKTNNGVVFVPRSFFPPLVSHQGRLPGQFPGCPGSLGAGREAAGIGGREGCLGEHVGFPPRWCGWSNLKQAGREGVHGGMFEQSGPSGDTGCC